MVPGVVQGVLGTKLSPLNTQFCYSLHSDAVSVDLRACAVNGSADHGLYFLLGEVNEQSHVHHCLGTGCEQPVAVVQTQLVPENNKGAYQRQGHAALRPRNTGVYCRKT